MREEKQKILSVKKYMGEDRETGWDRVLVLLEFYYHYYVIKKKREETLIIFLSFFFNPSAPVL